MAPIFVSPNCWLSIGSAFRRRVGAYLIVGVRVSSFNSQEPCVSHKVRPAVASCLLHYIPAEFLLLKFTSMALSLFAPIRPYNPAEPEVTVLKRFFFLSLLAIAACVPVPSCAQQLSQEKAVQENEQVLWQKLEATITGVDRNLDGVLGVAILDLTTGQKYFLHADEVLPTPSSIKISLLAELYHQTQQGKIKLLELYTLQSSDLVGGSGLAGALTPGV